MCQQVQSALQQYVLLVQHFTGMAVAGHCPMSAMQIICSTETCIAVEQKFELAVSVETGQCQFC